MRQIKPHRWWGITYAGTSNDVMPDTIRRTREEAKSACCRKGADRRAEWAFWHGMGCRPVRVIVTLEPQP